MIAGGNWWRANEIVIRHLTRQTATRYRCRDRALVLPRWKGDEEFQEMVTAILRSLPLKRPSVLSAQGLRHLVRIADGITARVFGVLNELAIDAVETGAECISDTVIETWKPAIE